MILDSDNNIIEKTNTELFRPIKKPISDVRSYISDLPSMTFRKWIDNVPYCIFEELVLRTVELAQKMRGYGGVYISAIKFSEHILNFIISCSGPNPYGTNSKISIDFVLCDLERGLRDACHRKELMNEQHKYYNTHRMNSWSLSLNKYTIVRFMYDFMKAVKDDIILQDYPWVF